MAKADTAHLEGARSARATTGLVMRVGDYSYLVSTGTPYAPDHPVVQARPELFKASGEHPVETRPQKDHTPKPRKRRAQVETVVLERCQEKGCGWERETALTDYSPDRDRHYHREGP